MTIGEAGGVNPAALVQQSEEALESGDRVTLKMLGEVMQPIVDKQDAKVRELAAELLEENEALREINGHRETFSLAASELGVDETVVPNDDPALKRAVEAYNGLREPDQQISLDEPLDANQLTSMSTFMEGEASALAFTGQLQLTELKSAQDTHNQLYAAWSAVIKNFSEANEKTINRIS